MRARSIQPEDIVLTCKRGRIFHATVREIAAGGGFEVAPMSVDLLPPPQGLRDQRALGAQRRRREGRPPTGQLGFDSSPAST